MRRRFSVFSVFSLSLAAALLTALSLAPGRAGPLWPNAAPASAPDRSPVDRIAVFGADDRIPLPDDRADLTASIGLIYEPGSQSVCTAFCVGDDVAATAGHCLFRTAGEHAPRLQGFTFRLAPKGAREAVTRIAGAQQSGAPQNVAAGTLKLRVRPPIDASSDWALMRLEEPICKGRSLPLSRQPADKLVELSTAQRVYQVSYHRDFGNWELALGHPCAIRRSFAGADWETISKDFTDARHVILHTCDTGEASSGSPMLTDGPAGPEVVGINVGTYLQSRVLTQQGQVVHRYKSKTVANTAVSAEAFRSVLDALLRADILAARDEMRALQRLLASEGYAVGAEDGRYGPKLSTAIRAFEQAEGRAVTGLATVELLKRLSARDAERRGAQPSPSQSLHIETGSVGGYDGPRKRRKTR
ncbi:hypothetical protein W911_12415 [Hyphomicrobium nitrativorans NL23]|uniref:Peptidoglycan binding-like domain-containing protein n=1 Tax=Hyphomicrobium nitrativorans NL23 TaxID=1029756 RepID=V5SJV3_9HYPH|nr:peptidoglycan-binding protein [Hyphomicrobium nitrativorans]AHB50259.1 hypothetical protein W911_12415 [Hyphomicrobium nitrativorans NL23]